MKYVGDDGGTLPLGEQCDDPSFFFVLLCSTILYMCSHNSTVLSIYLRMDGRSRLIHHPFKSRGGRGFAN